MCRIFSLSKGESVVGDGFEPPSPETFGMLYFRIGSAEVIGGQCLKVFL